MILSIILSRSMSLNAYAWGLAGIWCERCSGIYKRPDSWNAWAAAPGRFGEKRVIPLKRGNKEGNKKGIWHNHLMKRPMWKYPLLGS